MKVGEHVTALPAFKQTRVTLIAAAWGAIPAMFGSR